MPTRHVFVSSTTGELQPTRDAVCAAIHGLKGLEPINMEAFGARPTAPLDTCIEEVRDSQVFVGIIGDRYGSLPPEGGTSFTEREYDEAVALGLPRLMLLTPDPPGGVADAAQAAFRARIQREETAPNVEALVPDRFATHVVVGLYNLDRRRRLADLLNDAGYMLAAGIAVFAGIWVFDRFGAGGDATSQAVFVIGDAAVVAGVCALCVLHRFYVGVLSSGTARRGSVERSQYDALRRMLDPALGIERGYVKRLERFLSAVDRLLGDAERRDASWLAQTVGLRRLAPTLTAESFMRCMDLAIVYPFIVLVVTWVVTGHVGAGERAFFLPTDIAGSVRALILIALIILGTLITGLESRLGPLAIFIFGIILARVLMYLLGGKPSVLVLTSILMFFGFFSSRRYALIQEIKAPILVPLILVMTMCAIVARYNFYGTRFGSDVNGIVFVAMAVGVLVGGIFGGLYRRTLRWSLSLSCASLIVLAFGAAGSLTSYPGWVLNGSTLIFFVLLPALNAPFDWFAVGLTRALLRRGIELGGLWPYGLALIDAGLALVLIWVLAITMSLAIQMFDTLAFLHGGDPILIARELLDGVNDNPGAPEYWWLYATLFSTMIPSVFNLAIGGLSLFRGWPPLSRALLRHIPEVGSVSRNHMHWIPLVLTLQAALGVLLGLAGIGLLIWGVFGALLPMAGHSLLDVNRALLGLQLPYRLLVWLGLAGPLGF